jgi:hypothetical protein
MYRFFQSLLQPRFGKATTGQRRRPRPSFRPTLEMLEDRTMPSLIASQVLPVLLPTSPANSAAAIAAANAAATGLGTANVVTVLAPALTASSPTPQQITLIDVIRGVPTGGTVNFTLPGGLGTVNNVPVVNGVAQVVFTIPVGTPASAGGTVTATYSGTVGFAGSTSSGVGNGTLTFCEDGASTLLGTTLQTFAVLAGSTVTNTGPTVVVGNVGVSTGSAVTGFTGPPNGSVTGGTIQSNDAVAILAQSQLTTAYNTVAGATGFTDLTGQDLGGLTLTPGVYHFANSAQLTGTLTLNDQNNSAATFEFQIGSTLTTASGARVQFINGGADNVYWQVGSSATLGSSTVFAGNILAQASITLDSTASIACGRALARTGAVTLIDNFIDPVTQGPTIPPLEGPFRFTYRHHIGFGGFALQNNAAVSLGSSPIVAAQVAGPAVLNPTLQADVNASNSQAPAAGLAARIQSNNDAYVAALTHDGTAEILLFHGATNTFTVLASAPAGTNSAALQFTLNGSNLSLFVNGSSTPLVSVTDTTLTTAGGAGIFAWGPNGIVSNLSVSGS